MRSSLKQFLGGKRLEIRWGGWSSFQGPQTEAEVCFPCIVSSPSFVSDSATPQTAAYQAFLSFTVGFPCVPVDFTLCS